MKLLKHSSFILSLLIIFFSCVSEETPEGDTPTPPNEKPGEFYDSPIARTKINWQRPSLYSPRGVGGGGAMSGLAFSPYSSMWFVGTDMGTLFKSVDYGASWRAVHQGETTFSSDLTKSVSVGFSADPFVLFHAPGGRSPMRSSDAGESWSPISMPLQGGEYILYWMGDSYHESVVFCATDRGLLKSSDKGLTWQRLSVNGVSQGTYLDYKKTGTVIYHANQNEILKSENGGSSFTSFYRDSSFQIQSFAGGRDSKGLTLAFIDNDGESACREIDRYESEWGAASIKDHQESCGYLWTGDAEGDFTRRNQQAGEHLAMAENNSQIIYVTGSRDWIRQYGTKVWRSRDAGASFSLMLHQLNWDVIPFEAWDPRKIEYSAPALEQGWWDDGYESFSINQRDAKIVGGTGYFFLHTSLNEGENWQAPFTRYAGEGTPVKGQKWHSTGLEVTTIYKLKFHPTNSSLLYAAMADIGGMISEDGGKSFRISQTGLNSNYDYAFDETDDNVVIAATGSSHDFPIGWRANVIAGNGGVFKSNDRGRSWRRLTSSSGEFNRQFLSVAYDSARDIIYAGTQGAGVARSADGGKTWSYFNSGLPATPNIIPQIEVTPAGNVYILLTGDAPSFSNSAQTGIYYLDVQGGESSWSLLRGHVERPSGVAGGYALWSFPTAFAIDYQSGEETLWLVDYENNGNWLATGIWKSVDRGASWERAQQFTHPMSITLDPKDTQKVYVTGQWQLDGRWGLGGAYHSLDGGESWRKNEDLPFMQNAQGLVLDPNQEGKVFYHFFGSAILHGPRPELSR